MTDKPGTAAEVTPENITLATAAANGAIAERERIAQMLADEADNMPCDDNAACWRSAALFVRTNGSWYAADEMEEAANVKHG